MDVEKIISAFGGQTALARALGLQQGHVGYWKRVGKIPPWRVTAIREAADRAGVRLAKKDLGD